MRLDDVGWAAQCIVFHKGLKIRRNRNQDDVLKQSRNWQLRTSSSSKVHNRRYSTHLPSFIQITTITKSTTPSETYFSIPKVYDTCMICAASHSPNLQLCVVMLVIQFDTFPTPPCNHNSASAFNAEIKTNHGDQQRRRNWRGEERLVECGVFDPIIGTSRNLCDGNRDRKTTWCFICPCVGRVFARAFNAQTNGGVTAEK